MTIYEGMFLLDNQAVRADWQGAKAAVTGTLEKHGAKVRTARRWEERPLAYAIKGHKRGTYVLAYCDLEHDAIEGLRRDLELSEKVLRYLLLRVDEVPADEAEKAAAEDQPDYAPPPPPEDDEPEPEASDKDAEATAKDAEAAAKGAEATAKDAEAAAKDAEAAAKDAEAAAKGAEAAAKGDEATAKGAEATAKGAEATSKGDEATAEGDEAGDRDAGDSTEVAATAADGPSSEDGATEKKEEA